MGKIRSEKRKRAIELRVTLNLSTTEIAKTLGVSFPVAKRYIVGYEQSKEQKMCNIRDGIKRLWEGHVKKPKSLEKERLSRRKHYTNHKKYYLDRNQRKAELIKDEIRKIKESTPCADCKNKYPFYVMDFDHREDENKEYCVSQMMGIGRSKILAEIAKCDIVCANCHRSRTYKRMMIKLNRAPVAQQDSASVSETEGSEFESHQEHQLLL